MKTKQKRNERASNADVARHLVDRQLGAVYEKAMEDDDYEAAGRALIALLYLWNEIRLDEPEEIAIRQDVDRRLARTEATVADVEAYLARAPKRRTRSAWA